MLKGIPAVVSPELLKVLCEMGHGDELVIADGNFPVESVGRNARVAGADPARRLRRKARGADGGRGRRRLPHPGDLGDL